jgi:hypothetical protein
MNTMSALVLCFAMDDSTNAAATSAGFKVLATSIVRQDYLENEDGERKSSYQTSITNSACFITVNGGCDHWLLSRLGDHAIPAIIGLG